VRASVLAACRVSSLVILPVIDHLSIGTWVVALFMGATLGTIAATESSKAMSPAEMRQYARLCEEVAAADESNRTHLLTAAGQWRFMAEQLEALERVTVYRIIRRGTDRSRG
jgi:hypothetical protein